MTTLITQGDFGTQTLSLSGVVAFDPKSLTVQRLFSTCGLESQILLQNVTKFVPDTCSTLGVGLDGSATLHVNADASTKLYVPKEASATIALQEGC